MMALRARPGSERGRLREAVSMAGLTAWAVGGRAERLYQPADIEDLAEYLAALPAQEPVMLLGLGSNLLVRDGGVPGTVILTTPSLGATERRGERRVAAECGTPCAKLARFCARAGLGGGEFLAGIPGTIGGALAMNAGAFGGETWGLVRAVETVDRGGRRRSRGPDDYAFGYRHVEGPGGEWFVAAELELETGSAARSSARIRDLLRARSAAQPTGQRSCGSVFKNPPGDYAGRLIDAAGLKGLRIGGAMVSTKHGNFIVNEGAARAADVEALIGRVAAEVLARHGVRLEPEVRIVGVPAESGR